MDMTGAIVPTNDGVKIKYSTVVEVKEPTVKNIQYAIERATIAGAMEDALVFVSKVQNTWHIVVNWEE